MTKYELYKKITAAYGRHTHNNTLCDSFVNTVLKYVEQYKTTNSKDNTKNLK